MKTITKLILLLYLLTATNSFEDYEITGDNWIIKIREDHVDIYKYIYSSKGYTITKKYVKSWFSRGIHKIKIFKAIKAYKITFYEGITSNSYYVYHYDKPKLTILAIQLFGKVKLETPFKTLLYISEENTWKYPNMNSPVLKKADLTPHYIRFYFRGLSDNFFTGFTKETKKMKGYDFDIFNVPHTELTNIDIYKMQQLYESVAIYNIDFAYSSSNGGYLLKVKGKELHDEDIAVLRSICEIFIPVCNELDLETTKEKIDKVEEL
jgi:hypothetical protein